MKQRKYRKSSSMRFQRVRMPQGGCDSNVTLSDEKESETQHLSCDLKEEAGDEEDLTVDSVLSQENGRTKRQRRSVCGLVKPKSRKHESTVERWSAERYKQAEKNLLEILKAEGAVFGNPITRPVLRVAGRKRIGDTGLLDHLLKHIDGKVAPGGLERFRRWFNTDGVMEYWLESVELANMRQEAGVDDPYWVPPSWWKPGGGPLQQPASAADLKLLREEMADMKRDLEQLVCKKRDEGHTSVFEELRVEFLSWRAKTDQRLMELSSSLSGMQDMFRDLITWKEKTEQQLMELSNSLNSIQANKQQNATLSPSSSERWEDWLENNNLDNFHGEDVTASWFETANREQEEVTLQNACPLLPAKLRQMDGPAQDPDRSRELDALREEVGKLRRELSELAAKKQELDTGFQTKGASVFTTKLKQDDNPLILLQEMLKEWAKWKPKMEQQLMDISATVGSMQAPMHLSSFSQSHFYR
ncbi:hypothetical protein MLD38_016272 [Melastoma candidum]|uniref:Uncharacterized protein n=1 Tax=Melastoma candidum TaxID=119954 RepID=A0ACB9RLZ2_9MYRT|nr:hypothetical protein MLD38_016272 [Melastoma candidum]